MKRPQASLPLLSLREWSTLDPDDPEQGHLLRGLTLTPRDRNTLKHLGRRSSLRIVERRDGLSVSIGPHIGSVSLSCLHIRIWPKLRIEHLMRIVAYSLRLPSLVLSRGENALAVEEQGLSDLLILSLLLSIEQAALRGLSLAYVEHEEELTSPRGRIQMRPTTPTPQHTLFCRFEELTFDHPLNQALAAGLRWSATLTQQRQLRLRIRRAASKIFANLTEHPPLTPALLQQASDQLNRQNAHYQSPLDLLKLLFQSTQGGPGLHKGDAIVSNFLLDMNLLFEKFLTRYLRENAPEGVEVIAQQTRKEAFTYIKNPSGWRQPNIRPDLIFKSHGEVTFIADAKYRNRYEHPPTTAELYQLTTYGLAISMATPRRVVILHPLGQGERDKPVEILFSPNSNETAVHIHLCGVPLDALVGDEPCHWWPDPHAIS